MRRPEGVPLETAIKHRTISTRQMPSASGTADDNTSGASVEAQNHEYT